MSQTALLFISDCQLSAPHAGLRERERRSPSDVQLAVHCSETLDSKLGLSEVYVCEVSIAPLSAFHSAIRLLAHRHS